MFAFFEGASRKIARNLIEVTGLGKSLAFFQKNNFSNVGEAEVLRLLLAVDACNLHQTMKEDYIAREISGEDLQDTLDDYVVENLKKQTVIPCRDGAERMEQCEEILKVAAKFQEYWSKEEAKDPGPRFYCVKELLRRLNCEANTPIHDNLFEFVYEQHNRFIRYFRVLLEPFRDEEASADPVAEPQPLSVAIHVPEPAPERVIPPGAAALAPEPKPIERSVPEEGETPKAPAFRPLDLMDPLSGFPTARPPRREVRAESPAVLEPILEDEGADEEEEVKTTEDVSVRGPENGETPALENLMEAKEISFEELTPPSPQVPAADLDQLKSFKAPAFRSLDLMDPLSGFPNPNPLPKEKEKTAIGSPVPAREADFPQDRASVEPVMDMEGALEEEIGEKTSVPEIPARAEPDALKEGNPLWDDFTETKNLSSEPAAEPVPVVETPPPPKEAPPAQVPAFRPLDMMDTLSGFPNMDPFRGKEKKAESKGPSDANRINLPKPTPEMLNDLFKRVNPIDPREDQSKGKDQ